MEKVSENRFIYAIKFIACIFIVTTHARFDGPLWNIVFAIDHCCVPFFLAVSGRFLLYNRGMGNVTDIVEIRKRTGKSLIRLLKITGEVYLVYLIFSFCFHMSKGYTVLEWLQMKYNLHEASVFFVFNSGRFIYDGSYVYDHLWYLFVMIYVYILIYIFAPVLRKWYKGLVVILLGLLFIGEWFQIYYPIRPFGINISTWYVLRNWLFVGIPFVLIGILFNDYVYKRGDISNMKGPAIIMTVVGIISSYVELLIFGGDTYIYFGSVITAVGLLFLSECSSYKGWVLYTLGKRASSNIYFYHVLIIAILDIAAQNGLISWSVMTYKPLLVMFICFVLFCIKPIVDYRKRYQ
ncbi:acyltransferase family protein [Butyrivibrio sp. CB08]|uniref:acyltransferase family protein n=1 Tax=Butyrivibrio sp. CB08 TaxID=2364879 RepID=UPI0013143449|nr:acyltransferase family protein [Butyrivibrio sp. CB08]